MVASYSYQPMMSVSRVELRSVRKIRLSLNRVSPPPCSLLGLRSINTKRRQERSLLLRSNPSILRKASWPRVSKSRDLAAEDITVPNEVPTFPHEFCACYVAQ